MCKMSVKEMVVVFVVGIVIGACCVSYCNRDTTYEMDAVVTGITGTKVTVRDEHGHYFRFYATDDHSFHVGDFVELTMDTNGTNGEPFDDLVIGAEKL